MRQKSQQVFPVSRQSVIDASPEFVKKELATHGLNVGFLCGHGCEYCSTPSSYRYQSEVFSANSGSSFKALQNAAAYIDPTVHQRIPQQSKNLTSNDMVMMCTLTDGWSPEAQQYDVGRKCLEKLRDHSKCNIRILTKNAAVTNDFDIIKQMKERVRLSLSLTIPPSKAHLSPIIEPFASSVNDRIQALNLAHQEDIPIYGMLCPCLPGISDDAKSFAELLQVILPFNPEAIWTEPVNPRGQALINCEAAFEAESTASTNLTLKSEYKKYANEFERIRTKINHLSYTHDFIDMVTTVSTQLGCDHLVKILIYGDKNDYTGDDRLVIWITKEE